MNYDKLYYSIIERAIKEERKAKRYKGDGNYYEIHHIIPRSFGGSNNENNLVKLTAKEHFLVHWILVKRFEENSVERIKMLYAFNRMCYSKPNESSERKLNAHAFERYKLEYVQTISKIMSKIQKGEKNSQFGKPWYTCLKTGECKKFKNTPPNEFWIKGRNWFEKQKLYSIKTHLKTYTVNGFFKLQEKRKHLAKINFEWTKNVWDEFHKSSCRSIKEFYKKGLCNVTWVTITNRFKKYIPKYNEITTQGRSFSSNKDLIGIYN